MEVTLDQMLAARENRAMKQMQLIRKFGKPIISFCMNIPGPVKDSPLIRRGFRAGCRCLDHRLTAVLHREILEAVTGCEAMYVVDLPAVEVKKITTAIEDDHGLGRLFDMDVLDVDFSKLDRESVGGGSRDCIVCGAPGRGCASRRVHSVEQLQGAAFGILSRYFCREDGDFVGSLAVRSLLDEVCTTPKPGLVDHRNNGSHRDMDLFTFIASASALAPYFRNCAEIGQDTAEKDPEETFRLLRVEGLKAEETMFAATHGVNTHKGAVFTMGILCGACGRIWKPEGGWDTDTVLAEVARMTAGPMKADFSAPNEDTVGERLYHSRGIPGIRGEVANGLPSVRNIGLPIYRKYLEMGRNAAGCITLLHLIAGVQDTNMIARGGLEGAVWGAEAAAELIQEGKIPTVEEICALDDRFIEKNLSPGGCADLLAAVYFLHGLEEA